jgi:AcrR family transcriptional regulator
MNVKEERGAPGPPGESGPLGAPGESAPPGSPGESGPPAAPAPAARTKAAQREATTAALIAAARELFAERGYAGVGTEEIVQKAGVTRGALYHHFRGGKEDLFQAVLVQVSAETTRRVVAAADAVADPWQSLLVGVDAFLDASATPEVQRIMLVDGPSVLGWDVWRAADGEFALTVLEGALNHAMEAGRMARQPARPLAHVLLGAIDEAAMVVARAEEPQAAREEMGRTVRRLLDGLRGPVP